MKPAAHWKEMQSEKREGESGEEWEG